MLEAHRIGRGQPSNWLPLIFVGGRTCTSIIYGLFVVGCLLAVNVAQRLTSHLGVETRTASAFEIFRLQRWPGFWRAASRCYLHRTNS